jgi:hypothetical protein
MRAVPQRSLRPRRAWKGAATAALVVVTLGEAIVDTAEPGCKCTAGVAVFADRLRSVG